MNSRWARIRESLGLLVANCLPRLKRSDRWRVSALRWAGVQIAPGTEIRAPIVIRPIGGSANIHIGKNCFLNTGCRFGARGRVRFGDRVQVGPRVMFETVTHELAHYPGGKRPVIEGAIEVGDEVWIGAGAIIAGGEGVTLGKGCVVAAGAVVTRDVPARSLVGGVPAKVIKEDLGSSRKRVRNV